MDKAKLFFNGRSQAVRLPKEYRFEGSEVYIKRVGDAVLLIPKDSIWETFKKSLDGFSDDFMGERDQQEAQSREDLDEIYT